MARVRHILADGREVESIKGIVVPFNGPTASVYQIAAEFIRNRPENYKQKEETANATV